MISRGINAWIDLVFFNSITIYKSGSSQLARVKEKKGKEKAKAKKLEKEERR